MKTVPAWVSIPVILLLLCSPLMAGCLTIPAPGPAQKNTPAVTATPTVSLVVKETAGTVTRTPAATATPTPVITLQQARYASGTCTEQGGNVVSPGQQCKGTWLAATDSLNCCSIKPVPLDSGDHAAPVIAPFNLTVNVDDTPGSITP